MVEHQILLQMHDNGGVMIKSKMTNIIFYLGELVIGGKISGAGARRV